MFKFCPFVHNVPNDHHRTANICNNITCTDMIAALENSSIIYTPTCKVLIMTGFKFFCINLFYRALWNVPEIGLCTLRRSLGPHIGSPSGRRLNTISHSSAHIVDYAHITLVHNKAACHLFGRYSHMDSTLTNGSFNFLVDSQQLEYQKDKSILHILNV